MLGIGTKTARLIAVATLAMGVGAVGVPATAEAGDDHRRHGGHKFHGHHKQFKHGHFRRHSGHGRHFHRRSHHGFAVHVWRPPVVHQRWGTRACHPVVGHGFDGFGRQAKFGGTMCYDRFGNGYVVAGSQHVIQYF